ncbi:RagB/SusD family nutrient uptake outer membrane protein [Deminuibacter soli]|uniref:RagB/SusD family nutrient uptake outer membrane protein n=1 Tax=Deminuibacter soli TaxID=2291815 RepID=A0A3E1NNQ5_9BACT|nr:RagB/SusD family nutrient uptake outer membrane protein [Deminuibacter soli]RFM29566.1 RagB/SusD family nutrient uptake outer membrane protein [Deminuibacter soli]
MQALFYIRRGMLAAATSLLLFSCRKDLDKTPLSNFSNDNFWTSQSNALLALTGVYRGNIQMINAGEFSATDWWSYHGLLFLEFASDNAYDRRGENSGFNTLTNGTLTNSNTYISNYWNLSYARIARCNFFLENVSKVPADSAFIKRIAAEARFIRATQYFYLSQYFGDAPLVTKVLTAAEANTVTKATRQQLAAFVATELTACVNDLPRFGALTAAEKGRASKQAALAFLGRMQLSQGEYANAADTYQTLINYNDNTIDPDFSSLFDGTNESSKEIIFATQYVKDLAPNGMQLHDYPATSGGYHIFCPLGSLVESFEFKDGTPFSYTDARYNANDLAQNRDPRLAYTVLYNGESFAGLPYTTHPDSTASADQLTLTKQATRTGYGMRKFNNPSYYGSALSNSGIDLPIVRYAEILLSLLEAKLENGDAITQSLLDATINKVRGRTSVGMPPVTETDPAALRVIVRRERRNELAFEGLRLWDLLRWKTAAQALNGDFYGAPYPGAKNLRKKGTATDPFGRWYVTTKTFRAGTDEKWPVPLTEVSINPNLK